MTPERRLERLLIAVAIHVGCLAVPCCADAQWILEKATRRWIGGETVELYLPKEEGQQAIYVDTVLFDGRSVAFETVEVRNANEAYRVRVVVPQEISPGAHSISVQFSDTAFVPVPDLRGLTLDEARRQLATTGLTIAPEGTSGAGDRRITRQEPAAGTPAPTGSQIKLGFTAQEVRMPEIVGLTLDEARRQLEARGLVLGETAPGAASQRIGQQTPAAGAQVAPGTRIEVEVAKEVPNLLGKGIGEARQALLENGFIPEVVIREAADGPYETVLEQRPAPGQPRSPGSAVEIVMESVPDPAVPLWPFVAVAAAGLLGGLALRMRTKKRRRRATKKKYQIKAHNDLDRLVQGTTPPAWQSPELRLDIRLRGYADPGRQTLNTDGPLIEESR